MAPSHPHAMVSLFLFVPVLLLSGAAPARSQQPYGSAIADCGNKHNDTGLLGYFCSSRSAPSCESYLTFDVQPPYSDLASVAALLGVDASSLAAANSAPSFAPGTKILVPATCSCVGPAAGRSGFYQRNTTYVAQAGDTLLTIANTTFQGLSTCQAVQEQGLGGAAPESLLAGQSVTVPLRCACPSASQAVSGVRFLVSYLLGEFGEVGAVATRLGVDLGSILAANELTIDSTIYPFTTLLIPVKSPPDTSQLQSPPPPPPPPPVASAPAKKSSNHTGVYIGVGVGVGAVMTASVVAFVAIKARRRRAGAVLATGAVAHKSRKGNGKASSPPDEVSVSISEAFASLSDIKSSLKVYTYDELKAATDDFSPDRRIGGSVYRAAFGGDAAVVEIMDRDVSTEVELMCRINHFNLVRLTGLCHHRGRWYLVSEFAEHGTLRGRLLDGGTGAAAPLSWAQRVQIALDVAEGLRYLHGYARPPYVHMDVRSGSVLLAAGFRAKIRNFGGARVIRGGFAGGDGGGGGRELFTMTSTIAGTRGYVAPEHLEHGVVSPKVDVYSLGVVLLELVTGKDVEELEEDGGGDPLAALNALVGDHREDDDGGADDGAAAWRLEEFVDPAMAAGSCPRDAVVMMVRLIERCVRRDAAARPGMGEVAQYLLKLSGISGVSWQSSSEYQRSDTGQQLVQ